MRPFVPLSRRSYSTARLAFDKYTAKNITPGQTKAPLIICHGLFGSKQNWASLCRAASQRMQRDIYAVVRWMTTIQWQNRELMIGGNKVGSAKPRG